MNELTTHTENSSPPSIALAWGIWTSVCRDVGGALGLCRWGISPRSRAEVAANPNSSELSIEYYRRIDALSDEERL